MLMREQLARECAEKLSDQGCSPQVMHLNELHVVDDETKKIMNMRKKKIRKV